MNTITMHSYTAIFYENAVGGSYHDSFVEPINGLEPQTSVDQVDCCHNLMFKNIESCLKRLNNQKSALTRENFVEIENAYA